MKLLACGDLHIRETTPSMRLEDNFFEEVCEPKLKWIVRTANQNKAAVAIAGDIVDNASTRYELTHVISRILKKAKYGVYAVPGQHDMNFHSQKMIDTPYQTLIETGAITDVHGRNVSGIHGAGFGLIPSDLEAEILITHKCVTEKEPPFFLKDGISAEDMLNTYPNFKIIISGDYHVCHSFTNKSKSQVLFNTGPMYRKDKTQIEMLPSVFLIDTQTGEYERLYIPCKPYIEAFDLDKIKRSKDIGLSQNEDLDTSALREMMMDTQNNVIQYPDVVSMVSKKFQEERNILVNYNRLNSFIQRAGV